MMKWIVITFLLCFIADSHQSPQEKELLDNLLNGYNPLARPVENITDALEVTFGISLQQIVDIDETKGMVTVNLWMNFEWKDYQLSWNPSEYGDLQSVRMPADKIWTPDLLLYNTASPEIDSKYPTTIVVYSDGTCSWVPPAIVTFSCSFDMRWFPFDAQICKMKYGSWTYDGSKIDLKAKSDKIDISTYQPNTEWGLMETSTKRTVFLYDCCPEPYIDVTFTMELQRRSLYYSCSLITPCALISLLILAVFLLPPDSNERICLCVTLLLCLTVFASIVASAVPPTSTEVPIITVYVACMLIMSALSIFMTVCVLNVHHRQANKSSVLLKFCTALGRLMCMSDESPEPEGEKDSPGKEQGDWKFAARVIDRLCLCLFTIFFIITHLAIFCNTSLGGLAD